MVDTEGVTAEQFRGSRQNVVDDSHREVMRKHIILDAEDATASAKRRDKNRASHEKCRHERWVKEERAAILAEAGEYINNINGENAASRDVQRFY